MAVPVELVAGSSAEDLRRVDPYHIAADSVYADDAAYVLNNADTFAVIDRRGDIRPSRAGSLGLYFRDMRYLSLLTARINGQRPVLLSSTVADDNLRLTAESTNAETEVLSKNVLHLRRIAGVDDGACEFEFELNNFDLIAHEIELVLRADADFRDIFEVRGMRRQGADPVVQLQPHEHGLVFVCLGGDGKRRTTRLVFSQAPILQDTAILRFRWHLPPHARAALTLRVECIEQDTAATMQQNVSPESANTSTESAAVRIAAWLDRLPVIETNHPSLNAWLKRSAADLCSLIAPTPHGPYPYAGVPWYNTAFGRDGILTAFELNWAAPQLSAGVLRFLAATQARELEAARDAEPGKIVHETRLDELAALGEVPFGRYYGAVDGTPLFVALAGDYLKTTDDLALIRELMPSLELALQWIDRYGDIDGDGFVEYAVRANDGLVNQGWKDSIDSISHQNGSLAEAPIALCEVQGYVYAAWTAATYIKRRLGEHGAAKRLHDRARDLKKKFHQAFWLDALGTYALALDRNKRPCAVRASNAGQCLWSGIAARAQSARLARALSDAAMFSGWGVRTLAVGEARFNPMSYHNGSVWPHDNALIAAGLARYGYAQHAARIFSALLDAASASPLNRLPELYCGFARDPTAAPVPYPVACSPQAWAVGSVYLMLAAVLGLKLDGQRREIEFRAPQLPDGVDWLRIANWNVANTRCALEFRRHGEDIALNVVNKPARWRVVTVK